MNISKLQVFLWWRAAILLLGNYQILYHTENLQFLQSTKETLPPSHDD